MLKVFVELWAPNYPGSTYTLTYDPIRNELAGTYFQAALPQRFDVVFVRMTVALRQTRLSNSRPKGDQNGRTSAEEAEHSHHLG